MSALAIMGGTNCLAVFGCGDDLLSVYTRVENFLPDLFEVRQEKEVFCIETRIDLSDPHCICGGVGICDRF